MAGETLETKSFGWNQARRVALLGKWIGAEILVKDCSAQGFAGVGTLLATQETPYFFSS